MIRHIVLIKFAPNVSNDELESIWEELRRLKDTVPGLISITAGQSESPEQIERGYMHGFVVDFESWDALSAYAEHPDHKKLGARLVANAQGGLDGILVFDLAVE